MTENQIKDIECLATTIVNNTNDKNEVSIDKRQKNNDECFDFAIDKIKNFLANLRWS